jgi:hypothetical protein
MCAGFSLLTHIPTVQDDPQKEEERRTERIANKKQTTSVILSKEQAQWPRESACAQAFEAVITPPHLQILHCSSSSQQFRMTAQKEETNRKDREQKTNNKRHSEQRASAVAAKNLHARRLSKQSLLHRTCRSFTATHIPTVQDDAQKDGMTQKKPTSVILSQRQRAMAAKNLQVRRLYR